MSETSKRLEDVQKQIKVDDWILAEARRRREQVLRICRRFPGVLGIYRSGSVAMAVANDPIQDADGGMILDRRCYPGLGPEGGGETPVEVVGDLHDHIGAGIRETWPRATVHDMKRGLTVRMHEPLLDGQDPYIDVVVAMNRREGKGLWIPNMDVKRWDPSDPQCHVQLMTTGSRGLRQIRARVVRLAKAWNKQHAEPALSSFNIVALALEAITEPMPIDQALLRFFEHAAASLAIRRTEDPAKVSGPIKLESPKDIAVARLAKARDHLTAAIDNDGDAQRVAAELHAVFWIYLPKPLTGADRGQIAALLRTSSPRLRETASGIAVAGAVTAKRSFGGARG